ncbi:DUF2059 domain-containing protein [Pseudohoeflea coraliihabitans]|uniref:DUF2059 domain-containing protein n=1 Tax=Pseudohoeflea coraliihabitans TaxID=2860393 RepID=A0ABS6WSJ3_9HYPH|nr:DUF2059 domain-containing protein [Pseudohoeflea sp. DP4N28-3]MBW3098040.1 DUF2059 domain-containing protein [Pseudohoeflea sp. DP4N28-3]
MLILPRLKFACAGAALALVLASGATAFAQEPSDSHLAAARSAISALKQTDQFDSILPGAAARLKANLIQSTPDIQPEIDAAVDEVALSLASRRGDLEREAAAVYAKSFSEEELKAIADFYTSPAGVKLLESGPLATRELLKAAEIWSNGIQRDMAEQVAEKLRAELGQRDKVVPKTEQ